VYEQEYHEMHLEITYPSGAEEWLCPMCNRRFLMQWPPAYRKIVLEPGDEYAFHSGSKGISQMEQLEGTGFDKTLLTDELRPGVDETHDDNNEGGEESGLTDELRPWLDWMRGTDLDDESNEAA
jgi:hypothetical protein